MKMAKKEEIKLPHRRVNLEAYMLDKETKRLLEFQVGVFQREINRLEKRAQKRDANLEHRKEVWKPMFETVEELNEAYMLGDMDPLTYNRQRVAIWNTYTDYGSAAKLEWLYEERDKYQSILDMFVEGSTKLREEEREQRERRARNKYYSNVKRVRRQRMKRRAIAKEKKKKEMEERLRAWLR